MQSLNLKQLLKPKLVGLTALVAVAAISLGATCRVVDSGTTAPVNVEFGYRVELPDRCSVVVGVGRSSQNSTDYMYCLTPEGGLSRFDRGASGIAYNTWAEVAYDCNRATIPLKAELPANTAILKNCTNHE